MCMLCIYMRYAMPCAMLECHALCAMRWQRPRCACVCVLCVCPSSILSCSLFLFRIEFAVRLVHELR